MPRRLPAVYDPVNGKLYGEDPIAGLLEVATGGGGGADPSNGGGNIGSGSGGGGAVVIVS